MRTALLGCLMGACVAVAACDRSIAHEVQHQKIPRDFASQVKLGETTPADVQSLFGSPDQTGTDGALVYQSERTRQSGKVDRETTTFRFEGGVLSKVCQNRS